MENQRRNSVWNVLERYRPRQNIRNYMSPDPLQQGAPIDIDTSMRMQALTRGQREEGNNILSSLQNRQQSRDMQMPTDYRTNVSPLQVMGNMSRQGINMARNVFQNRQSQPQPNRRAPGRGTAYEEAPGNIRRIIDQAAKSNRVNENLIAAIIKAESNFKPSARSHAGAQGLMQLMPGTARGLGVRNPNDPSQNVQGGTKYISQMMDKYDDIRLALAAYNWGPGNVDKALRKYGNSYEAIKNHMPKETRNYVPRVLNNL